MGRVSFPVGGFARAGPAAVRSASGHIAGCWGMEEQSTFLWPLCVRVGFNPMSMQAVKQYLDLCELEGDVALEAAMHSDDEEWID